MKHALNKTVLSAKEADCVFGSDHDTLILPGKDVLLGWPTLSSENPINVLRSSSKKISLNFIIFVSQSIPVSYTHLTLPTIYSV